MQALFVELPAFSRYREEYLDDDAYSDLQKELLANPEKGDLILLFTIYGKDIQKDLTPEQKRNLANMLKIIKGEQ